MTQASNGTRRIYDDEFKAKAVIRFLEAKNNGKPTITELAKELGVNDSRLYSWADKAKAQSKKKPNGKPDKRQFPLELKERAVAMHRSGTAIRDISVQLGVPYYNVHYWINNPILRANGFDANRTVQAGVVTVMPATPSPAKASGAQRDALIYLTHAEKKIMDMIRDGKLSKPDPAHLLTLLALTSLQEAMGK